LQEETIAGVPVWVLPNPSGLNAHFKVEDFGRMLAEVRAAVDANAYSLAEMSGK
jgi:TDG/mug DNA glycosylase family protein